MASQPTLADHVVQVRLEDGTPLGTGILLKSNLVLTCRHVIESARGQLRRTGELRIHRQGHHERVDAIIAKDAQPYLADDIAVLRTLKGLRPVGEDELPWVNIELFDDHYPFSVVTVGFRNDRNLGIETDASSIISWDAEQGCYVLSSDSAAGHSGGLVARAYESPAAVGMIVARSDRPGKPLTWLIPAGAIARFLAWAKIDSNLAGVDPEGRKSFGLEDTVARFVGDEEVARAVTTTAQRTAEALRPLNNLLVKELRYQWTRFADQTEIWERKRISVSDGRYDGFLRAAFEEAKEQIVTTSVARYQKIWDLPLGDRLLAIQRDNKRARSTRIFIFEKVKNIKPEHRRVFDVHAAHGIDVHIFMRDLVEFEFPSEIGQDWALIDNGQMVGITRNVGASRQAPKTKADWYCDPQDPIVKLAVSAAESLMHLSWSLDRFKARFVR